MSLYFSARNRLTLDHNTACILLRMESGSRRQVAEESDDGGCGQGKKIRLDRIHFFGCGLLCLMSPGAGSGSRGLGVGRAGRPDPLSSLLHRVRDPDARVDALPPFQESRPPCPAARRGGGDRRVLAQDRKRPAPLPGRGGCDRFDGVSPLGAPSPCQGQKPWPRFSKSLCSEKPARPPKSLCAKVAEKTGKTRVRPERARQPRFFRLTTYHGTECSFSLVRK